MVYGTDDRRELVLAPSDALRRFGAESVVALIEDQRLQGTAPDNAGSLFGLSTWGERDFLCDGVRFREQPAVATCSGVLVDADLVLTAGHCARNLDCDALNVVFGYHYIEGDGLPELGPDDVYRCGEVLSFETRAALSNLDYGWLRLDRAVSSDKQPAAIASPFESVEPGEVLQAFGFGGGVPLKFEPDVSVLEATPPSPDYFVALLDAFRGASGGPLIRDDGSVVGTLALGEVDYELGEAGCNELRVLPESDAAEQITYAARALQGLCRDAPDTPLCRAPPSEGCTLGARSATHTWDGVLFSAALVLFIRARRSLAARRA